MATKKAEAAPVNGEATAVAKSPASAITYTADEFARASATVFDGKVSADIVRAAFRTKGIESATVEDAKKLVNEFAHKEVKK